MYNNIIALGIRKYEIVNNGIKNNQLLYCTDTKEAYFDISNTKRIQLDCTIQLDTERDRIEIAHPLPKKIYIVKESNTLYQYQADSWNIKTSRPEIIDLLIPANELVPTTLTKDGINIAPKTIASEVYTNDGRQVQNIIDEMLTEDKKIVLYTKTQHVIVERDGQKVFNIPFPIPHYDLAKFPIMILVNNSLLASHEYAISIDQLILVDDYPILKEGDLITFIFHYNVTISNDSDLDASSINNVRFFVGPREPYNYIETDVWFDTIEKAVKQYMNGVWEVIVKNQEFKMDIAKSSYTLTNASEFVPIGIDNFKPESDLLFVYENSTYIEEVLDYRISSGGYNIYKANNGLWYGDMEDTTFNFIVFRNVKGQSTKSIKDMERDSILNALGLTDNEFINLKSLIKKG